jgi:hypothetical protein
MPVSPTATPSAIDVASVSNTYAHVLEGHARGAADRIGARLHGSAR